MGRCAVQMGRFRHAIGQAQGDPDGGGAALRRGAPSSPPSRHLAVARRRGASRSATPLYAPPPLPAPRSAPPASAARSGPLRRTPCSRPGGRRAAGPARRARMTLSAERAAHARGSDLGMGLSRGVGPWRQREGAKRTRRRPGAAPRSGASGVTAARQPRAASCSHLWCVCLHRRPICCGRAAGGLVCPAHVHHAHAAGALGRPPRQLAQPGTARVPAGCRRSGGVGDGMAAAWVGGAAPRGVGRRSSSQVVAPRASEQRPKDSAAAPLGRCWAGLRVHANRTRPHNHTRPTRAGGSRRHRDACCCCGVEQR